MLRSVSQRKGAPIDATDGDIGRVSDFHFDDQRWVIRYLVVETGSWLFSRKGLITPMSLDRPQARFEQRLEQHSLQQSPGAGGGHT